MSPQKQPHFDIDASIVFQLGEDLITDEVQALVELIKNSYDADASYARIIVDSEGVGSEVSSYFADAQGFITIDDDGTGMNKEEIEKGWLTISSSAKRQMKSTGKVTRKERTPLGDKGLGRLGCQRLGGNVEIVTRTSYRKRAEHVGWKWEAFRGTNTLSEVIPRWGTFSGKQGVGTRIIISGLREPERWTKESYTKLVAELSKMISPFDEVRGFRIEGEINGKKLELAEISKGIRRAAQVQYKIEFDGKYFSILGHARLDLIRASGAKDAPSFEKLIEDDGGDAFFTYLAAQKQASRFSLKRSTGKTWFLDFSDRRCFDEIAEMEEVVSENESGVMLANPGPFRGEIDGFDLKDPGLDQRSPFNTNAEYRNHIKDLSGVRIYRDGFGIRVDQDWLGLGAQWTGAGSYYGLKPKNTLGYVALSARDNSALVETTDREGFKDTPHYRNFLRLFEWFVRFAHDAQEFIRRGWLDYQRENRRSRAEVQADSTAETLIEAVGTGMANIGKSRQEIQSLQSQLTRTGKDAQQALSEVSVSVADSPNAVKEVDRIRRELENRIRELEHGLIGLIERVDEGHRLAGLADVLRDKVQVLREQLAMGLEAMSLGLTAEILAHEVGNTVDQLATRTRDLDKHLSRKGISDSRILSYVEYVRAMANSLRKQIGHLTPSLRFARSRRTRINLAEFCRDLAEYHQERWSGGAMRMKVTSSSPSMTLLMNRGKLTQVCDNFILNSEYWLREDVRLRRIDTGVITFKIGSPCVVISDNGFGIDPSVEDSLFEPFVTRKRNGRGLGLFIASELLDSEGCSIRLKRRRNKHKRLYMFEIDFSDCIEEGE